MCDCLPKMLCVYCIYIYIYIYHVNKFEARLLFLYLPLKNLLNAKWKVVPARNSGWKKRVPI